MYNELFGSNWRAASTVWVKSATTFVNHAINVTNVLFFILSLDAVNGVRQLGREHKCSKKPDRKNVAMSRDSKR